MAKDGPIKVDEKSISMFTRYMQERAKPTNVRKSNKEIADEFDIPERTFLRKIKTVQQAMDDLNKVAEQNRSPEDTPSKETASKEPEKKPKVPGRVSQGVLNAQARKGGSGSGNAVAVRDEQAYGQIVMPDRNPLDGLSEDQVSQAGVAVGIVFGGGLAKMGQALSDTDRPLGERARLMAQGSNAVANTLLGVYESLRVFGLIGKTGQPQEKGGRGAVFNGDGSDIYRK
jgi:hypothetical protein